MKQLNEILDFSLLNIGDWHLKVFDIIMLLIVIMGARLLLWAITKLVWRRFKVRLGNNEPRVNSILQVIRYLVYAITIALVMEVLGIAVTVLVAGSTALLVGLGLGLQTTFNDFVSGVIILFEGSVEPGDVVEVAGTLGRVQTVGLRTSVIETRARVSIIVPNSQFVSDRVINWSHQNYSSRVELRVGVAYGSNVPLVRQTLMEAAARHPHVTKDPEPEVYFQDFGDSALVFDLIVWLDDPFESEIILSELRYLIDDGFRAADITIPFPQRDLHIRDHRKEEPAG